MAAFVSDAHRIIVSELERHLGERLTNKKRVAIPCPFHNETDPSMYINLDPHKRKSPVGGYYCFGCRAKTSTHGGWNGLAAKLGLAQFEAGAAQITTFVRREIDEDLLFDPEEGMDVDKLMEHWNCDLQLPWPETKNWRGLPGWLMRKLGAFLTFDEKFEKEVCILPQWNGNTLTGAVKAQIKITKKTKLKYLSAPGEWVKTHALFPYHLVALMLEMRQDRCVFLVEGPRDALRLIGCGIPALALLGTNNWSDEKRDLLMTLDPDRVFLAFDNDSAGKKAIKLVRPSLQGYATTRKIRCWSQEEYENIKLNLDFDKSSKADPGNVPVEQIRDWKRKWKIETTRVRDLPDYYDV